MEQAHDLERIPYTLISDELQLGYSTIMRWKRRKNNREIIIGKPGPKKIEPLDLQALASKLTKWITGSRKQWAQRTCIVIIKIKSAGVIYKH